MISPTAQSQEVKLEFKLSGNNSDLWAHFALETYFPRYERFGFIATGNRMFVQYSTDGSTWYYPKDLLTAIDVGAWYVLTFKVLPPARDTSRCGTGTIRPGAATIWWTCPPG